MKHLRATALRYCEIALRYYKQTLKTLGVVVLAILMAACGPLDAIEGTLYGVKQFFIEAKASGEIVPEKADFLITDTGDAVQSIRVLRTELDAIPSGPEKKQQQFAAVRRAAVKWRDIYTRGHFTGVNPQVERYGRLANAAFIAIESYYASRAGGVTGPESGKSEQQLKAEMEQAIKELEAAEKELKR